MKYVFLFLFFFSLCCGADSYQAILQKAIEEYDIPGLAVAMYFNGTPKTESFGVANRKMGKKVDQNTIFDIASITKVFTSTAIALKVLDGKMSLLDPITNYLPKKNSDNDLKHVTIKSLLTQTSSLPRSPPSLRERHTFESVFHYLLTWHSTYPPETQYLYSNLGFGVLGYALANAEKKPYRVSIKVLITKPLGMTSTLFQVPPALQKNYAQGYRPDNSTVPRRKLSALPASGALKSSAADMLKFLMANLRVSGPKNLQEAMQLTHREFFVVSPTFSMGLGWQRITGEHILIVDKNGGLPGFSSYIGMMPYKKIGIVLLANKSKVPLTRIGRTILKTLASYSSN